MSLPATASASPILQVALDVPLDRLFDYLDGGLQVKIGQRFLNDAMAWGRDLSNEVMIYDPLRPQMEKLKGMERGHLLFQAKQRSALQMVLQHLVQLLREHPLSNKIRWSIDVDPIEF